MFRLPLDLGPLRHLKAIGYGGADICFFASGIGCFYSLSSEADMIRFMKRRLKRILPTYLVFMVVWLTYQYVTHNFGIRMAIGNLLGIQNFTGRGREFNWYISAMFLFYILAPYFKRIAGEATPVRKLLFLCFLPVASIHFWNAQVYIITVSRLPIIYIGMLFAHMCQENRKISVRHVIGMIVMFILGAISIVVSRIFASSYLWSCALYCYPFILITPPLCIAVSCVAMLLEKTKATKPIVSFLSLCGNYSFELYLIHILLISCISALIKKWELFQIRYLVWAAGGVLLVAGCFMLRRFTVLLNGLFMKFRKQED